MLFGKHMVNEISYTDIPPNSVMMESFLFSWTTHGTGVLAKYMPITTGLINE